MRSPNPYGMDLAQPYRDKPQTQRNQWFLPWFVGLVMGVTLTLVLVAHRIF